MISKQFFNDFIIRSIKIIDIGFATVLYVLLAYFISILIDTKFGKFNKEINDKKSIQRLFLEVVAHIWVVGIFGYLARNLIGIIPFPLDGYMNFKHLKVKEVGTGSIFITVFFWSQKNFLAKVDYLHTRIIQTLKNKNKK